MELDAIKLELIQWLNKLEDDDTLEYLKVVKDSRDAKNDWWHDLTADQKAGIARGLQDIDAGKVKTHREVKHKYGL